MKFIKFFTLVITLCIFFCSCSKVDSEFGVTSEVDSQVADIASKDELPQIMSLDSKMSKYFDISLFDEENYSDVYLGRKFDIEAKFADSSFTVPTRIDELAANGWTLLQGSDYDEKSLIFAKETVSLYFTNDKGAKIWALFYNSSNSSVRLSKCNIVKFRIENSYFKTKEKHFPFDICGVTNTSVITDVIEVLGTPSHFYQMTEDAYYFDYFIEKRDRRNKIRIYVDLINDLVTAIEFSHY